MRFNTRVGTLATAGALAAGALAVAGPAAASPTHHEHSDKCKAHGVAYVESGTVTSSTLVKDTNSDLRTGTLVVAVNEANHWAKNDKGTTVSYTFTGAKLKLRLGDGITSLTPGERVSLIGELRVVGEKCPALSPASTPVVHMVVVHPARRA